MRGKRNIVYSVINEKQFLYTFYFILSFTKVNQVQIVTGVDEWLGLQIEKILKLIICN